MSERRFKAGDVVEWTSQSGGYRKTKRGVVVRVILAGQRPDGKDRGWQRDHESYEIAVKGSKSGTYWPRVSALKLQLPADAMSSTTRPIQPARVAELLELAAGDHSSPGLIRSGGRPYIPGLHSAELRELLACYALYVNGDDATFDEAMEPDRAPVAGGGAQ